MKERWYGRLDDWLSGGTIKVGREEISRWRMSDRAGEGCHREWGEGYKEEGGIIKIWCPSNIRRRESMTGRKGDWGEEGLYSDRTVLRYLSLESNYSTKIEEWRWLDVIVSGDPGTALYCTVHVVHQCLQIRRPTKKGLINAWNWKWTTSLYEMRWRLR